MSELTPDAALTGRRIGYLISRYPAISHTFILREVLQLRRAGMHIESASINAPDIAIAAMPEAERAEADRTFYVKRAGVAGALSAHLQTLLSNARGWLRGLRMALFSGGLDPKRIAWGVAYFTEALMVAEWMRRERLDHLHVHFATAAAHVGLYVKEVHGVSLSLTVHGPDEFDDVPGQRLREKIAAADFVFCISFYARSQVMRLSDPAHWPRFDISRLGVDPDAYMPNTRALPIERFHIVCVGRLTPAKGQHVLLDAVLRLRQSGRALRLTLAGAGPDADSLAAAVRAAGLEDCVTLTGALNQTGVRALYAEADAFVLASFAEGVPVVLMEAMACGLPCVSTRITGIPELISNDDEGLLVPASDVAGLAAAIARLMDEPELRARISRMGRAKVIADYNLEPNVARLGALFTRRLGVQPGTHR